VWEGTLPQQFQYQCLSRESFAFGQIGKYIQVAKIIIQNRLWGIFPNKVNPFKKTPMCLINIMSSKPSPT
jgi:hypothetical protein